MRQGKVKIGDVVAHLSFSITLFPFPFTLINTVHQFGMSVIVKVTERVTRFHLTFL